MVATTAPGSARRSRTSIGTARGPPGRSGLAPDTRDAPWRKSGGARSLSAIVVDPSTCEELPDGRWGDLAARATMSAVATGASRRDGFDSPTLRETGDRQPGRKPYCRRSRGCGPPISGMFVDDQLYVTGRIADMLTIDGVNPTPRRSRTAADASTIVRRGYVAAFTTRMARHRRGTRARIRPFRSAIGIRRHSGSGNAARWSERQGHFASCRPVRYLAPPAALARQACRTNSPANCGQW